MGFTVPIADVLLRVQTRLEEKARDHTITLFRKIVTRTPVDTGRTRANWNVSFGAPNYSYGPSVVLSRSMAQIAKIRKYPIGVKVYLANGAPHIRLLEYGGYPQSPKRGTGKTAGGFSTQAPAGMVRISVAEFGQPISAGVSV